MNNYVIKIFDAISHSKRFSALDLESSGVLKYLISRAHINTGYCYVSEKEMRRKLRLSPEELEEAKTELKNLGLIYCENYGNEYFISEWFKYMPPADHENAAMIRAFFARPDIVRVVALDQLSQATELLPDPRSF